MNVDLIRLV